ncbi:MAG: phosphate acyltransferase PlsX [Gammaproteobacteria bacterium]|nr:phosphate acyltransferase PlsX [Gammaproteobacteria bacterium]
MPNIAIAIDAMGGDFGPEVTIPCANRFASNFPNCKLILYGDKKQISPFIDDAISNIEFVHCSAEVHMGEKITSVFRKYKSTSMGKAINAQLNDEISATVSAGNTGALMAISYKVLKTLDGILRPAIISSLPTKSAKDVFVLDLGANVTCSVDHMTQFALMGEFVAKSKGIKQPRIGILNIGEESNKGNDLIKQSFVALKNMPINFIGYIEPTRLYSDEVDVVVCDGFTGNILLKSCEGTSKFLKYIYQEAMTSSFLGMLTSFLLKKHLKAKLKKYDPKFRNGAMFVGLNGIVVKSHGGACVDAFYNAIHMAYELSLANPHVELKTLIKEPL